jgi:hypothetical protein
LLALWTGQRKGDLLKLPWSSYDGLISVAAIEDRCAGRVARRRAAQGRARRRNETRAADPDQQPEAPRASHGFQASWGIAARKAGIVGVTFHDLRGTAVTRLAIVGCSEAEIAFIMGFPLCLWMTLLSPQVSVWKPASPNSRTGHNRILSHRWGSEGLCRPDGFRAMAIKFPTWVSEYFLLQIERPKFSWLCQTTLYAQGGRCRRVPFDKAVTISMEIYRAVRQTVLAPLSAEGRSGHHRWC